MSSSQSFVEELKSKLLECTNEDGFHPLFIRQTSSADESVFVFYNDIKRLMAQSTDPRELLEPEEFARKVEERVFVEMEFSRQMATSKEKVLEAFRQTAVSIAAQIAKFSLEVVNRFPPEFTQATEFKNHFNSVPKENLPAMIKEIMSYLIMCSEVPEYYQPYDPTARIEEELRGFQDFITRKLRQKISNFKALAKQESPDPCLQNQFHLLTKMPGEVTLGERGLALQSSKMSGRLLAILSKEGVLEMADPKSSKTVYTKRLKDFPTDLENGVAFSPCGKMLGVSNHLKRSLEIFETQTGVLIRTLLTPFHLLPPLTCFIWLNKNMLAMAYYSGEISCFTLAGKLLYTYQFFSHPVFSMTLSSKNAGDSWSFGNQLICGDGAYRTGRLFKISLSSAKVIWEKPKHHEDWIRCVTQGELLGMVASGGDDGVINVIEEENLTLLYRFQAKGWVLNISWSGCEQFLMVGSREEILAVKLAKGAVAKKASLSAKTFQAGYEFRSLSTNWESGYLVVGSQGGQVYKLNIFSRPIN